MPLCTACVLWLCLLAVAAAHGDAAGASDAACARDTAALQAAVDRAALAGGGPVALACGFHAIGPAPLALYGGVALSGAACEGGLVLGACTASQMHIVNVTGDDVTISGVTFDASNLTSDADRDAACVHSSAAAPQQRFVLEDSRFLGINTSSQGFHAVGLTACVGCTVRGNYVAQSGGDALNFNAGEYTITGNTVEDTGDGCIALNNDAVGVVAHNTLRRCNLGIGAGPAGTVEGANASQPFVIEANLIEDCDYGVLLGWFAYKGRVAPVGTIVANNIIRRCRSASIRNDGAPGRIGGGWVVTGNQVSHAGYPSTPPPRTQGDGPGLGIVVSGVRRALVRGNVLAHGRGDAVTVNGAADAVVQGNIISADVPQGGGVSGVSVSGGTGISVADNTVTGFGRAISVAGGADRVRVTNNAVEAAVGGPAAAISADASVGRTVVAGNTVAGAGGMPASEGCVAIAGATNTSREQRANTCW